MFVDPLPLDLLQAVEPMGDDPAKEPGDLRLPGPMSDQVAQSIDQGRLDPDVERLDLALAPEDDLDSADDRGDRGGVGVLGDHPDRVALDARVAPGLELIDVERRLARAFDGADGAEQCADRVDAFLIVEGGDQRTR